MPVLLINEQRTWTAVLDEEHDPHYRYHLTRNFPSGEGRVAFVMLNPSTADHQCNDDTVDKCINLAKHWGYRTLEVGNLYARYATCPNDLQNVDDQIGQPYNDEYLRCIATRCDKVVAAWGAQGEKFDSNFKCRANDVVQLLLSAMARACREPRIHRLILSATADGHPLHPARKSVDRMRKEVWSNPY